MGGGGNDDVVRALLGQAVLSGKASGSDVTALQTLGLFPSPPSPEERKATEEKRKLGESFKSSQSQLGYLNQMLDQYQSKDVSGLFPFLKAKFGKGISKEGLLGGFAPSQETNLLEAAISDYNTRLFEIAGKAFTGPEKSILEGLILGIDDDEARLKDKIYQANRLITNKGSELGFNLPNQGGTQNQSLSTNITQTGGGQPPTPKIPAEGILNFLLGRTTDYAKKAMGGELEQQKEPLSVLEGLTQGAGPIGLALAGRGDVVRETMAPAAELATYILAPGLYKKGLPKGGIGKLTIPAMKPGGTTSGGILGALMGGTSPEEQTLGQRATGTALGAGSGAILGKLFEAGSKLVGKGKAEKAIGEEMTKRTPIKSFVKDLKTQIETETKALRAEPGVEKLYKQEVKILDELVKDEGGVQSGKLLEHLLKRVYPLSKYGQNPTGKQRIEANFYKTLGNIYRNEVTGVNPEVNQLLQNVSAGKQISGKLGYLGDVGEQTATRAGIWALMRRLIQF
jgi:hypothetical protein